VQAEARFYASIYLVCFPSLSLITEVVSIYLMHMQTQITCVYIYIYIYSLHVVMGDYIASQNINSAANSLEEVVRNANRFFSGSLI
jgi:hypothetical protein